RSLPPTIACAFSISSSAWERSPSHLFHELEGMTNGSPPTPVPPGPFYSPEGLCIPLPHVADCTTPLDKNNRPGAEPPERKDRHLVGVTAPRPYYNGVIPTA